MNLIIGESSWTRGMRDEVKKIGAYDATVLIMGPTGTGKELIARTIHDQSPRRNQPFVTVDCGAIAPSLIASQLFGHVKGAFTGADYPSVGFFRAAEGGTIFLDEIGELPAESQAKLLRVIQERTVVPVGSHEPVPVNVRIVAATNRDLEQEAVAGRFRTDLLYRLNVVPLNTIPLCERPQDIEPLVTHFLARLTIEAALPHKKLSPAALELLQRYDWPGNVRQLQNLIERAVLYSEGTLIEAELIAGFLEKKPEPLEAETTETPANEFLPVSTTPDGSWPSLASCHAELIERTLTHTKHNRSAAAHLLRIDYRRLNRLMSKYGVTHDVPQRAPALAGA